MSIVIDTNEVVLHHGDCIDAMRAMPDASVDAVVTDPPYGLEFMGRDWDAPWRESDVNADAGMSATGYSDGGQRLPRPSFTGSTNPKCLVCKGTRRGRRDGTAKVAVCLCKDGGRFPNTRAVEMRAFGEWCESWAVEALRVLKPGGHLLAFGGTRTWHRLAVAIEDAGFEIRDSLAWMYGSGFPKSMDVAAAIDKAARGVPQGGSDPTSANHGKYKTSKTEGKRWDSDKGQSFGADGSAFLTSTASEKKARQSDASPVDGSRPRTLGATAAEWQGWGTALKPAFEPIVVARKPLAGTVAGNVLAYGTGALNIDASRIGDGSESHGARPATEASASKRYTDAGAVNIAVTPGARGGSPAGRFPANVILDGTQAEALDRQEPGAARFYYTAKADSTERPVVDGIAHPTVKPLDLMRWLVRLVTPRGGVVLEPFAGSGTTLEAAVLEGFRAIGIEREADYIPLIEKRLDKPHEVGLDLFGGAA